MTTTTLKTKLQPLGDRVVLRRIENDGPRRGVVLPGDAAAEDQQSQECEVVEVPLGGIEIGTTMAGVGAAMVTRIIATGDRVYIAKHKGYGVTTADGEDLVVVDAVDILCVVTHVIEDKIEFKEASV